MDEEAKLHLKEWLIAQIEGGKYEGLCWEDDQKTMFRIPWKHAAKKDYKQTEDAALFKVNYFYFAFSVHAACIINQFEHVFK